MCRPTSCGAETGIGRGFDKYDAALPAAAADVSPGQVQRPGEETLGAAETWLSTLPDDRFFLFLHLYEPHTPYSPPARFSSLAPYDGEIAYADEIVGKLFADLKRRAWYANATIVVLSDHGEGLGDHGELEHGLFVYEEAIHVPWLMKLPGGVSAGRRVADPIQHIDLAPTLTTIAHLTALPGLRGRDLGPLLHNTGRPAAQGIYSEALYPRYHFGWSELQSLTDERYKFIKAPHDELYDLQDDPHERKNIVSDRAQAADAIKPDSRHSWPDEASMRLRQSPQRIASAWLRWAMSARNSPRRPRAATARCRIRKTWRPCFASTARP